MEDINLLLETPFRFVGAVLLGLVVYYIKKEKEDLKERLTSIEDKITHLEKTIDDKNQFIIEKILAINPDRENVVVKLNNNATKVFELEKMIAEFSKKLENLSSIYQSDITNFKKILVKFREELNSLHGETKNERDHKI